MKHPKKFEAMLYSTIGVGFMLIVILGLNLLFSPARLRVDMTADKLFTLADGTKKILKKVDSPIEIRFYCSKGEKQMPSNLKDFAQNVEDLLAEFKAQNPRNILIKKFDPKPDSEAEDLARLDGIEAHPLPGGEQFYMGVAISLDPQKVALPYLARERERLLEYDLARAIARVLTTTKPVVGLMTPLPIMGMQLPPQMAMQMRQRNQEPWVILNELKASFDVQTVNMDAEKIDENIKVLMVVHPKNISDKAQFAIDQFILRGGKLIAFLDPACLVDQSGQNQMGMNMGGGSSLPKLLKAWGIEFDTGKVAGDLNFMKQIGGPDGNPRTEPTWLFVNPKGINAKDAVLSQLDDILLPCPGVFAGTPASGLKMDTLLHTTKDSQLIDSFMAQMGGGGQKAIDEFKRSDKEMALAIRLTGKFKTAFPDGKPAEEKKDEEKKD
ncbi:MAG: GldG family protein, partial [Verrucomicrobia bacterium]|nr:GldG family protein [Verrucomicrobiota bacterium]